MTRLLIVLFSLSFSVAYSQSDIHIELVTNHPLHIVLPGEEDRVYVQVKNTGTGYETGLLDFNVNAYSGNQHAVSKNIAIKPGDSVRVEIPGPVFNEKGIHWLEYVYIGVQQDTINGRSSFAFMEPIGNDYEQDNNTFKFGIAGIRDYNPESFALQLKAAQLMGAAYERKYASWGQIQRKPDTWNWEQLDKEIETAEKYGLERQLLINGGAQWAVREKYKNHPKKGNTPPRLEPWATYVSGLANRYKDRITYYEIWNEPDIGFYHGTIDEYLEILKTAYNEIKTVDDNLQVMSGGFASAIPRPNYLEERGDLHREVVKRGQQYFDIHAFHRHSPFNRFRNEVEGPLKDIRSLLKENKPLWFNETAMHSTFIGEKEQARVLFKKLTYGWARGAMGYTWFNMLSNPNYPASHHEHNYGMLTRDFSPKAVYVTYNQLVTHLHDKQLVRQLETPEGYYAFLYENDNEKVIASWKEDESKPDLLYLPSCKDITNVKKADIMGNEHQVNARDGKFPLLIDRTCTFYVLEGSAALDLGSPQIKPEVEAGTDEFTLTINQKDGTDGFTTELLYPEHSGKSNNQYDVQNTELPSAFDAKLQYTNPAHEWVGIINVPVRLLTPVTSIDWQDRKPDFVLNRAEQVTNRFEHDPATTHLTWHGPEDVSAKGWFSYREDNLIITLSITDDHLVGGRNDERGDYVNLMFYLTDKDKLLHYRLILEDDKVRVVYEDEPEYAPTVKEVDSKSGNVYQLGIRFNEEQLDAGIGYNLQIHDNDGEEVEGYIQLAPGMGVVDEPHYFPVMKLK